MGDVLVHVQVLGFRVYEGLGASALPCSPGPGAKAV